jgi:hypothetical protein
MQVLYITGLTLSALVGIWHFFVLAMFQWYSYIPNEYKNLIVGINWTNIFFSMLLAGYSFLLIFMRKKIFNGNKEILIIYGFMVFVWFCRVAITFINSWPLEPIAWAVYMQQIASFIIFIVQLIPLIYLIKNYNQKAQTTHNRTVYAAGAVAPLASIRLGRLRLPRLIPAHFVSPGLCFAKPLFGLSKRRKQPERYVQLFLRLLEKLFSKY